jgi:hypothetical protein
MAKPILFRAHTKLELTPAKGCHLHLDAVVKQDHHNKHLFSNTLMMLEPFCDVAVAGTTDTYVAAPSKEHLFFVYTVCLLQKDTK